MAVSGVGGSSGAAAAAEAARQAALEAQRRAAEAARRQAEAARRAAETARKAAEAARRQAAEARKHTLDSKSKLQTQEKALKTATGPEKKDLQQQVTKQKEAVAAREKQQAAAEKKLQAAEEEVARTAKESETRMREANTAAQAEGKKAPYTEKEIRADGVQANEIRNAFEGSGRRREDVARTLGMAPSTDMKQLASNLEADRQYAKLASKPENGEAMQKLGIRDGASLRSFGERIQRQASETGAAPRQGDVPLDAVQDKKALAQLIQGAGATLEGKGKELLSDEKFATKVAGGRDPREAAQEYAGLSDVEKAAGKGDARQGLDSLGVSQAEFRDLDAKQQKAYLDAAKSTAQGKYRDAVKQLADAGKGAEEAITTAAANLPEGPEKAALQDRETVGALLKSDKGQKAIDEIAAGKLGDGLRTLDGKAPASLVDRVANEPSMKASLDKMGLSPDDLKKSGKGMADLVDAAQATDPQKALESLTKAGKADPASAELATRAIAAKAKELPPGSAREVLQDPELVGKLLGKDGGKALDSLVAGDTPKALSQLGGDKALRDRVLDGAAKDPAFQEGLKESGLDVNKLKAADKGLPELARGVELLGDKSVSMSADRSVEMLDARRRDAMAQFQKAAEQDPKALDSAVTGLRGAAQGLSSGAEKGILSDEGTVRALLTDKKAGGAALEKVIQGNASGALSSLDKEPKLREAVIGSAAKDPTFKKGLDTLGVTPAELGKSKADAALLDAANQAGRGDPTASLSALREAYAKDPGTATAATEKLAGTLSTEGPQGQLRTLLSDRATAKELLGDPKLKGAFESFSSNDIAGGLDKLPADAKTRGRILDTLGTNAEFKKGLEQTGLSVEDLKGPGAQKGLGDLYKGIDSASKGDFEASLRSLRDAVGKGASPDLATKAVTGFADKYIQAEPAENSALKSLLTDKTFVKNLLTNPKLEGAFNAFSSKGLLDALGDVKGDKTAANQAIDALLKSPEVTKGLETIGITEKQLRDNLPALPQLIGAATSAADGKLVESVGYLKKAADAGMEWKEVRDSVAKTAESMSDSGAEGLVKRLLGDEKGIDSMLKSGGFADSLQKGDVPGALQALAKNPEVQKQAITTLLKDPKIAATLERVGIKSAEDFEQYKEVGGNLLTAAAEFSDGDIGAGVKSLADAFRNIPDEKRGQFIDNVAGKLAGALPIPEQYKGMVTAALSAGGKLLSDPEFMTQMGDAFKALKEGKPADFVAKMAEAAKTGTELAPEETKTFLNEIGKRVGGPVGTFFADPKLNSALVDTGALGKAFEAVQNLAEGKMLDAIKSVGEAFMSLKDAGGEWKVAGVTLPVGQDGIGAIGGLLGRVYEVMPDSLKTKIGEKVAEIGGKGLLGSIPIIGDGINIASDIGPFIDALQNGDNLDKILTGAQLGLDVAGIIPGGDAITTPLKQGIGVVQTIKELGESVETANELRSAFG